MYNRYIPQPDGSYSRRQYQDTPPPQRTDNRPREERWQPAQESCSPPPENQPQPQPRENPGPRQRRPNHYRQPPQRSAPPPPRQEPKPPRQESRSARQETSALGFLKALLPKDFDTGDLLIVLLLLLMSGDCQEDQNTALLTLVLYLFL